MNKYSITLIILLVLGFLSKKIQAQTYPFINYTVESGLSQGQVLAACQDDEGIMWFGTSGGGITKFDGHSYEYITDKDGLADNVVYCIVKDNKGRILIGTNNGLSVYDSKKIKNYTTKNGLSHNRIFTIFIDKQNDILLGTGSGISKFQDTVCSILNVNTLLNNSSVFHLMKDSKNQLWCSTLGNGVFQFKGKHIENYTTKNGIENDMVFAVLEYSPEKYWFFTGEGLNELSNHKISTINPAKINSTTTYYSYFKDKQNILWIATGQGLIKFETNGKTKLFTQNSGLVNNSIWKIFQDIESNLWFTSDQNGLSKLSSERFLMYTKQDGLLNNEIKSIYINDNNDYYIGSSNGLTIFTKNKQPTNYGTKDFLNGNANISAITKDLKGNYLLGSGNGLLIYDGSKFKRIICKNKESQMNAIYDIFVDIRGEIWLATQAGVAKIIDGHIQAYDKINITKSIVDKIHQDNKGNIWFGTDEGLYKYDGVLVTHFTEKDGMLQKRVRTIKNDIYGNLWFASSSGIYKYDYEKFINITDKDSLSSSEVFSLVIDKKNTIWAGLSSGMAKIDGTDRDYKIRQYEIEDGFIGQDCSQNCMAIDNDGKLLIGTSKGLMIYQSEYDNENKLEPFTKIKSIDLFFQKTDWKLYSDSINNNIPYNLELPYNKNYLTFNFVGVSLTTPSKVSYQYMLVGIDKDWRNSQKNEVSYSNIPPGNYKFLLKANNGKGVWNKVPIIFQFVISPPFWKTWWFYSIIAFIVLSGIYSYIKIRSSNVKILKQNELIEEKNNALNYANNEIAEKNRNITDSINYAKRIQQSFLTSDKIINQALKNHFILFKPRNIVSGDFYLAFDLPDRTIVMCSDCTGHGIPGAFMSLISISMLNEIFRSKITLEPAKILDELRSKIIQSLNPDESEDGAKDGMDVALISIFKDTNSGKIKIHFAGGNNTLHLVTNENESSSMIEFKGDNQPVGYFSKMKPFTQHEIIAHTGDTIYLYTDGFADQFGGPKGKKFMTKQLKQTLIAISHLPIKEQLIVLDKAYKEWQGSLEQVDDVTVIGIKL